MSHFARSVARNLLLGFFALAAFSDFAPTGQRELPAQQEFDFDDFNDRPRAREEISPAEIIFIFLFYGIIIAVALAIHIAVCFMLFTLIKAVPPQFRVLEPGMVWLLLIPLFSIVWIFFVYVPIARSYQNYFRSMGRYEVGDCGESVGLWYCVCVCLSLVPCVGWIAAIVSLVLLIIYFVTLFGLKGQIQAGPAQPKWGTT